MSDRGYGGGGRLGEIFPYTGKERIERVELAGEEAKRKVVREEEGE